MHGARKVRAAPCGQRMSVFRALECAGSGALVQQRCSSARLACSPDQAMPAARFMRSWRLSRATARWRHELGAGPRMVVCNVIRAGSQQRPRYLLYVPGARYGAALHQARDKQCPGSISLQKVTSWMLLSVPMRELLACSQPAIHRQDTCTELTCRQ